MNFPYYPIVIRLIEMIAAVVCAASLGILMLNNHERDSFPPLRFLIRRLFPRLEHHDRHRRVSLFCGVALAIFAAIGLIAVAFPWLGKS